MNIIKLNVGAGPIYRISPSIFEEASFKRPPYYQNKGTPMFYAVCPACDNPVEIVGLYKLAKPYGRHHPQDIPGLAQYSQEAYDFCPYAKPQKPDPRARKQVKYGLPTQILNLLQEQFDRIIYILSKDTGIIFSEHLAKQMLKRYLEGEGYLYPWSTLTNLPWIFGHLSHRWTLWGRIIRKHSPLYEALNRKKHIIFNEKGQLNTISGKFVDINFLFMKHQFRTSQTEDKASESLQETIDFVVTQDDDNKILTLYKTTLNINQEYFLNLINTPEEKAKRNQKLLMIAKEIINV